MDSKTVVSLIVAMSLASGGFAFAQGQGDRYNRGRNEQAQRGGEPDRHHFEGHQRDFNRFRVPEMHVGQREERGAGPAHQFFRGERLPVKYRHRNYVVDDWRGHHLNAPPRGYHWVQTGADYVLVAIATGVILQLLLHNEYE